MPTAYTSKLYEGEPQTFPEFAMECARGFGALVHLRDSMGAEIPYVIEPDGYHVERQDDAEREFERLQRMSYEEIRVEANEANDRIQKACDEVFRDLAAKRGRYEAMLAEVEAWDPPTKDHQGLKDFMVQQLSSSLQFDCSERTRPALLTPAAWHAERFAKAQDDIAYHAGEYAKECNRAADRTAWIQALRASLPALDPSTATPYLGET